MKAVKDMLKLLIHAMNRVGITSRRFTMWIALLLFTGTTVSGALNHGFSTDREERIRNIFSKTLEELVEMEVTSVTCVEHRGLSIPPSRQLFILRNKSTIELDHSTKRHE